MKRGLQKTLLRQKYLLLFAIQVIPPFAVHEAMKKKKPSGFSLIEVTLALGVVSFALVAVLGLIPVGMVAFRKAVDVSVGSQIVQQVVADFQQADFATLTQAQAPAYRYFDDQGVEQTGGKGLYQVNVVVDATAGVPGAAASTVPGNLARLIVEIVKNPANRTLVRGADGSIQADPTHGITVARYPAFVAKSQ